MRKEEEEGVRVLSVGERKLSFTPSLSAFVRLAAD